MTALHWAAYNDDREVIQMLLAAGAKQTWNRALFAPVDLAGFCGNYDVV